MRRIKASPCSFVIVLLFIVGFSALPFLAHWTFGPDDPPPVMFRPLPPSRDKAAAAAAAATSPLTAIPLVVAGVCQESKGAGDILSSPCTPRLMKPLGDDGKTPSVPAPPRSRWTTVKLPEEMDVPSFEMLLRDLATDKYISRSIFFGDYIELNVLKMVVHSLPGKGEDSNSLRGVRVPVMVDVGGNIGMFTLTALALGARTFTFEPIRSNVGTILHSIQRNNFQGAMVFNNAVSYEPARVKMESTDPKRNLSNERVTDSVPGGCREEPLPGEINGVDYMDAVTLDQIFGQHLQPGDIVDVMKIDVESFEAAVINGALRFLCATVVRVIVMEIAYIHTDERCSGEDMYELLKDLGYRAWTVPLKQDKEPGRDVTDIVWSKREDMRTNDLMFRLQNPEVSPLERMRGDPSSGCKAFE